jgi:membrane protein
VASALAFTTLLALVPLVTVVFSMLSLFPVFEQWSGALEAFLFQNFVPAAGDTVKSHLHQFSDQAGKLTAVGLVFLLLSSLLLLATIEDAFNDIWRVQRGRVLFQRLLVYWAVLSLGPLLIMVSLSMSSTLLSLKVFSDQSLIADARGFLLRYLPLLFELGAYVLFFKAIPNTEVKLRHALIGGAVATVLFELAKLGFAYYILSFRSYELIYGALSTIPIFFVWVYLSWVVMLVGAVITSTLKTQEQERANTAIGAAVTEC